MSKTYTVFKEVEIDVDLADYNTSDLAAELGARIKHDDDADLNCIVDILADADAPQDIINALRGWLNTPVASPERLEAWKKWALAVAP